MIQIKTVIKPYEWLGEFDETMNKLLADGWELKKRSIINCPGDVSESFDRMIAQTLYAELEKDIQAFEEITL